MWSKALAIPLLLILVFGSGVNAQVNNPPFPNDILTYQFEKVQTGYDGYFLTVLKKIWLTPSNPDYVPPQACIIDGDGNLVWYCHGPHGGAMSIFKYFPQHNQYGIWQTNSVDGSCVLLDEYLDPIDTFTVVGYPYIDSHELQVLDNGNRIVGGIQDTVMDLSTYTINGASGSSNCTVIAYIVQELTPNDSVIFEWNSLDHIHPTEFVDFFYPYDPNSFDYCHGNAIELDLDSNYLISFRHLNAIYKVDRNDGQVMWILGGESNQFTMVNDSMFSGQHDIRRLSNGNISLFDNGNCGELPRKSRGMEYALDTISMTATKISEYVHSPIAYGRAMGSYKYVPGNYALINYGRIFRPSPSALLLDNGQNIIAKFTYTDTVVSYRVGYEPTLNLPTPPSVSCSKVGNDIILSAPLSYSSYQWSTGETTSSITVSDTGTYQVWVNYGIGMLGSDPVYIDDISTFCQTSIEETGYDPNVNPIKYFNLSGQEIPEPISGKPYIALYADGTWKKRMAP